MLGSGWIFRVSRGKCGVVLLWEGRERVAGARARLGDQFRWILEVFRVFDCRGVMGRSSGFSGWISEGNGAVSCWKIAQESGWSSLVCSGCYLFLSSSRYRSTDRSFCLQVCGTAAINCRWQEHGHEAAHAGPVLAVGVRAQAWPWQELEMAGGSQQAAGTVAALCGRREGGRPTVDTGRA